MYFTGRAENRHQSLPIDLVVVNGLIPLELRIALVTLR